MTVIDKVPPGRLNRRSVTGQVSSGTSHIRARFADRLALPVLPATGGGASHICGPRSSPERRVGGMLRAVHDAGALTPDSGLPSRSDTGRKGLNGSKR
jgi:hypothetical protein